MSSTYDNPQVRYLLLALQVCIGKVIVQECIAQLVGHKYHLPGRNTKYTLVAPFAFSFGFVGLALSKVFKAVGGGMTLMPLTLADCATRSKSQVKSWELECLLKDNETKCYADEQFRVGECGAESLIIDTFRLGQASTPKCDAIWWLGWATISAQVGIACVPWVLFNDKKIVLITLGGSLLSTVTVALPQWVQEKWPARILQHDKVTVLTRMNEYYMVVIAAPGCWNLEDFATEDSSHRLNTRWISVALEILWACLLISAYMIRKHSWILMPIGVIGLLQNVLTMGALREARALNLRLTRQSTRVWIQQCEADRDKDNKPISLDPQLTVQEQPTTSPKDEGCVYYTDKSQLIERVNSEAPGAGLAIVDIQKPIWLQ